MRLKTVNKLHLFQAPQLEAHGLVHASFTRLGGASTSFYGGLNVGENVGDDPQCVEHNRTLIRESLGIPALMSATQVHGTGIEYVTDKSDASTLCCDVLVTDKAGVGLLIKHADCQACILYDPVRHVLALIHAGWRGNVQNIYLVSVQYLRSRFGSKPRDILAAISPSLGPTAAQFTNYTAEFPKALWRFRQHAEYFDLWKLSEHQLLSAGILPQNLLIARRCTYTEPELFYSYRREGITGRLGTVAMLPLS